MRVSFCVCDGPCSVSVCLFQIALHPSTLGAGPALQDVGLCLGGAYRYYHDHKVVSIGEGSTETWPNFMLQLCDRYCVLILRYSRVDKLAYSPHHPGRGYYRPSIEGWLFIMLFVQRAPVCACNKLFRIMLDPSRPYVTTKEWLENIGPSAQFSQLRSFWNILKPNKTMQECLWVYGHIRCV